MKTLGKLKINVEKMLKNEELVNLKGGYGSDITCKCNGQYIVYYNTNDCWAAWDRIKSSCSGTSYCFC